MLYDKIIMKKGQIPLEKGNQKQIPVAGGSDALQRQKTVATPKDKQMSMVKPKGTMKRSKTKKNIGPLLTEREQQQSMDDYLTQEVMPDSSQYNGSSTARNRRFNKFLDKGKNNRGYDRYFSFDDPNFIQPIDLNEEKPGFVLQGEGGGETQRPLASADMNPTELCSGEKLLISSRSSISISARKINIEIESTPTKEFIQEISDCCTSDCAEEEQFLTIAGALSSKGDVYCQTKENEKSKGVTGIDLMVAGPVEFQQYNLHELQPVVQELLIQEYLEYEKLIRIQEVEIPDYAECRIIRRNLDCWKNDLGHHQVNPNTLKRQNTEKHIHYQEQSTRCCCCSRANCSLQKIQPSGSELKKIEKKEADEDSNADIDEIDNTLNLFMKYDIQAKKNWRKIKFRLQVISQFQSLSRWMMEPVEEEPTVEETTKKKDRPWYIINENSTSKLIWNAITNIVYVGSFFLTAFTLAFEYQPLRVTKEIEMIIDIFTLLDIFFEFITTRTTRGNRGEITIDSFCQIAPEYITSTFFFDLASCLPGLITQEQVNSLYPLKVFRYIQLYRTFEQMQSTVSMFKMKYMQNSIYISNCYMLANTMIILVMIFHLFACAWIYIGDDDDGWRYNSSMLHQNLMYTPCQKWPAYDASLQEMVNQECSLSYCIKQRTHSTNPYAKDINMVYIYCNAIYYVTTNATTIGYGDFYASTRSERLFSIVLEFTGILVFSSITSRMQTWKRSANIMKVIDLKVQEINNFMFEIDKTRSISLDTNIYDNCQTYINYSYHFGVASSFTSNPYYKELSVNLKNKLISYVLRQYYELLYQFFNDLKSHTFADFNFVRKLLVSLDCQIFNNEQTVIDVGQNFTSIFFNYNNKVKVVDWRKLFVIADLGEGSWFGDFNIFFGLTSQYQYIACSAAGSQQEETEEPNVRCLACPAERLLTLCEEYPKVSRFLYKRALMRRNYFRLIESKYNMNYKVSEGYDFLMAAARKKETQDIVKQHWQSKITRELSRIDTDPYSLKDLKVMSSMRVSNVEHQEIAGNQETSCFLKDKAEMQISALCTETSLHSSTTVLCEATKMIQDLRGDLENELFGPAEKLRAPTLEVRRDVQQEMKKHKINRLNIRKQRLSNMQDLDDQDRGGSPVKCTVHMEQQPAKSQSQIASQKSMVNRPNEMIQSQHMQDEAERNEISDLMKFRKKQGDAKSNYKDRLYNRKSSTSPASPVISEPQSPVADSPHFGQPRKLITHAEVEILDPSHSSGPHTDEDMENLQRITEERSSSISDISQVPVHMKARKIRHKEVKHLRKKQNKYIEEQVEMNPQSLQQDGDGAGHKSQFSSQQFTERSIVQQQSCDFEKEELLKDNNFVEEQEQVLYTPRMDRIDSDQNCWEPIVEHISNQYVNNDDTKLGREMYNPTQLTAQPANESRGENYTAQNIYGYTQTPDIQQQDFEYKNQQLDEIDKKQKSNRKPVPSAQQRPKTVISSPRQANNSSRKLIDTHDLQATPEKKNAISPRVDSLTETKKKKGKKYQKLK